MDNSIHFIVIIPTLDRDVLERAKASVLNQTYQNYDLIIVHDKCDPEKVDPNVLHRCGRTIDVFLTDHNGTGGCRNAGIVCCPRTSNSYFIFLDDDDYLVDEIVLEHLARCIADNSYPDMVRLGYKKYFCNSGVYKTKLIDRKETDILSVARSNRWGSPTKAIKANRIVPFVEKVKHQDLVQHLAQCDVCETVAIFEEPFFVYSIYDRPDKAKDSPESKLAAELVPKLLREEHYMHPEIKEIALKRAKMIEEMYS